MQKYQELISTVDGLKLKLDNDDIDIRNATDVYQQLIEYPSKIYKDAKGLLPTLTVGSKKDLIKDINSLKATQNKVIKNENESLGGLNTSFYYEALLKASNQIVRTYNIINMEITLGGKASVSRFKLFSAENPK